MSFDRIGHTTGLLHKIKFYCVYSKMFLLIEPFISSRRLRVMSKYKSSSKSGAYPGGGPVPLAKIGHLSF